MRYIKAFISDKEFQKMRRHKEKSGLDWGGWLSEIFNYKVKGGCKENGRS